MIPQHDWKLDRSDAVWNYWVCTRCPNHSMRVRRTLEVITPDDHKVSTCPYCGNYCNGGCRPRPTGIVAAEREAT